MVDDVRLSVELSLQTYDFSLNNNNTTTNQRNNILNKIFHAFLFLAI